MKLHFGSSPKKFLRIRCIKELYQNLSKSDNVEPTFFSCRCCFLPFETTIYINAPCSPRHSIQNPDPEQRIPHLQVLTLRIGSVQSPLGLAITAGNPTSVWSFESFHHLCRRARWPQCLASPDKMKIRNRQMNRQNA